MMKAARVEWARNQVLFLGKAGCTDISVTRFRDLPVWKVIATAAGDKPKVSTYLFPMAETLICLEGSEYND